MNQLQRSLPVTIIPALLAGGAFELFLGHRHDYTGHFLAGYGGTLGAMMIWLKGMSPASIRRRSDWSIVAVCLACILIGVFTEATAFRLAKFDEVDFCSQSLGAVFAGIVAMAFVVDPKPADPAFDRGVVVAVVFFSLGGFIAVA